MWSLCQPKLPIFVDIGIRRAGSPAMTDGPEKAQCAPITLTVDSCAAVAVTRFFERVPKVRWNQVCQTSSPACTFCKFFRANWWLGGDGGV
jgi:hypothetical protein